MATDAALFELFIPSLTMIAGGFLLYRGVRKLEAPPETVSGRARRDKDVVSTLDGYGAVYSHLVLERSIRGRWEAVARSERRMPFYVGGVLLRPQFADFDIAPKVVEGRIRHELGVLEQFMDTAMMATTLSGRSRLARGAPAQQPLDEGSYLPERILSYLGSIEEFRKPLERNGRKLLRVTEYAIREGALIHACGGKRGSGTLSGELESRLLIADSGAAGDSHRERAIMGMAGGAVLTALSFFLFYLIIFSV